MGENKGAFEVGVGDNAGVFCCFDVAVVELRAWEGEVARWAAFTGLVCVRLRTIWPENKSNDRPINTKSVTNPI